MRSTSITPQMLALVAELDEFKGRWEALGKVAPEKLSRLRKVATIESIGSSTRIEGARLSDEEVESLLANLGSQAFRSRDEEEVAGYAEAMNTVFGSFGQIELTENCVKQLHGILLRFSSKDTRHRGEYKKFPNHVEAFDAEGKSLGVIFETALPFDTPRLMEDLVSRTARALENREVHPLLMTAEFVVRFLAIHPFQDGNGRLSRILTTLILLRSGYGHVPYSSLERVVEENKDAYYRALRASQKTLGTRRENLGEWMLFFLRTLKKQKDVLLQKVETERVLERMHPIAERLLALATERGRLTIADAVTLLEINRNTAKAHLRILVRQGQLVQNGTGKATWYTRGGTGKSHL